MANCVFCKIAAQQISTELVYQDEDVTVFRDMHPQAPVHLLIIPNAHIASTAALSLEDAQLVGKMLILAHRLATEAGVGESGYRLVVNCGPDAGQEVQHLHLHLLGGRELKWPPG